jgi:glycopeptide antibiotics resistance protein
MVSVRQHPAGSGEPIRPATGDRDPSHGTSVHPRVRVAALLLLAAYLAFVAWQSLRPLSVLWVSPANLQPFDTIRSDIERGPGEALDTIGSGMLRLAPLGVLLPLLGRRVGGHRWASLARTVFAGAMIALIIEWLQSLVPSRVSDVDTIILNTAGIALAHLLGYGRLRSIARHEPRSRASRRTRGCLVSHRDLEDSGNAGDAGNAGEQLRGATPGPTHGGNLGHSGAVAAHERAAPHGVRGAALSR